MLVTFFGVVEKKPRGFAAAGLLINDSDLPSRAGSLQVDYTRKKVSVVPTSPMAVTPVRPTSLMIWSAAPPLCWNT